MEISWPIKEKCLADPVVAENGGMERKYASDFGLIEKESVEEESK